MLSDGMKKYKTINVLVETWDRLYNQKEHPRETMNDVIDALLDMREKKEAKPNEETNSSSE